MCTIQASNDRARLSKEAMNVSTTRELTTHRHCAALRRRRSTVVSSGSVTPATLGCYLDAIGVAIGLRGGPVDGQALRAVTDELIRAASPRAGPGVERWALTSPRVVLERALGRLSSQTICRTIALPPATRAVLDTQMRELVNPAPIRA